MVNRSSPIISPNLFLLFYRAVEDETGLVRDELFHGELPAGQGGIRR